MVGKGLKVGKKIGNSQDVEEKWSKICIKNEQKVTRLGKKAISSCKISIKCIEMNIACVFLKQQLRWGTQK